MAGSLHAVVLGASGESIHAIRVAQELGFVVTALDGDPGALGLAVADKAMVVDISRPEAIAAALPERPDVILPAPIGRYLTSTGVMNDRFGLPGVSATSAARCTDKLLFHRLMAEHGLRRSPCVEIPAGTTQHPTPAFPVVVKPRFGSGSRGVVICEDQAALTAHLDRILPAPDDMIVEECAGGTEYGMDAAVVGGRLEVILLREKILTPLPYRQAVGYYSVTDPASPVARAAATVMQTAVRVLGLTNCLLHADLMWDEEAAFVIEVSARPSGHHLHDLFTPLATGMDPVREFLKLAVPGLGSPYCFTPTHTRTLLIRFFDFANCRVTRVPTAEEVRTSPVLAYEEHCLGEYMPPVTDGPTLLKRGYAILEAADRAGLDAAADDLLARFALEKD